MERVFIVAYLTTNPGLSEGRQFDDTSLACKSIMHNSHGHSIDHTLPLVRLLASIAYCIFYRRPARNCGYFDAGIWYQKRLHIFYTQFLRSMCTICHLKDLAYYVDIIHVLVPTDELITHISERVDLINVALKTWTQMFRYPSKPQKSHTRTFLSNR